MPVAIGRCMQRKPAPADHDLQAAVDASALPLHVDDAVEARANGTARPPTHMEFYVGQKAGELREAYAALIERRIDGVDKLYDEVQKRDVPKPTSGMKQLLVSLTQVALNQVTGGLAGTITRGIVDAKAHPILAGFARGELTAILNQGMHGGFGGDRAASGNTPALHADVAFKYVQTEALEQRKHDSQRGITEIANASLEQEDHTPGAGVRAIDHMIDALRAATAQAGDAQYRASFMAWNSFLAQSSSALKGDDGDATTATGATDLSTVVDAVSDFDFRKQHPKLPGVLQLELGQDAKGKLSITSARLAGHGNEVVRNALRDVPLKDLRMPVVAELEERPPEGSTMYPGQQAGVEKLPDGRLVERTADTFRAGFTVGRSEDGTHYARNHASPLYAELERTHGDVATHVLDHELGAVTLDKVKA